MSKNSYVVYSYWDDAYSVIGSDISHFDTLSMISLTTQRTLQSLAPQRMLNSLSPLLSASSLTLQHNTNSLTQQLAIQSY